MRVTVFGATGKIGRLVVERLPADGHDIITFSRNPGKLTITDPHPTAPPGSLRLWPHPDQNAILTVMSSIGQSGRTAPAPAPWPVAQAC
jgi:nucleoside-diphosphate-sugar epimerase